jgi:hypothetical protein
MVTSGHWNVKIKQHYPVFIFIDHKIILHILPRPICNMTIMTPCESGQSHLNIPDYYTGGEGVRSFYWPT